MDNPVNSESTDNSPSTRNQYNESAVQHTGGKVKMASMFDASELSLTSNTKDAMETDIDISCQTKEPWPTVPTGQSVESTPIECSALINSETESSFAKPSDSVTSPLEALGSLSMFRDKEKEVADEMSPDTVKQQKRKNESADADDMPELKKSLNAVQDDKKGTNTRRNIRDVMDENQLDSNTLVAQREESERLARVAEQQKLIREYQRQSAVNRQYARTQNRVLSLLQSGNTFAKVTDLTKESSPSADEISTNSPDISSVGGPTTANTASSVEMVINQEPSISRSHVLSFPTSSTTPVSNKVVSEDVVTIEDSSSEDDCILLSDDEEELEEEVEEDPTNSGLHVKDTYNVPDEQGRVLINIGHPEGEEDIFIAPQIAKTIKPHQIGGVRFLYDNIIESTKRFKSSSGFGCILAHSMGLGKTLQVICFCDIFLRHTQSKTVLCVMPINTLQNWVTEFNMWTPKTSDDPNQIRPRPFDIFILNDQQKTLTARAKVVLKWAEEGGVLLIGYELFRLMALKLISTRKRRGKKSNSDNDGTDINKRLIDSIHQALVKPGPDLVICDEGHRIKNAHAGISLALKQIRTRRRIVLTGYPLQNNLLEYWCMVDFVRPNYLGTRTEFCNMFERPIQNGQCIDSTPEDIKLMRYRAHVLHSLLGGFVQRRSHVVLQQTLPLKTEYVILTRMTTFQRKLYDTFMNDVVRTKTVPNPLKAFAVCCKIWNHPDVLYNFLKKRETDLDLEIDDGEVASELPNTPVPTNDTFDIISKKEDDTITALNERETNPNVKVEPSVTNALGILPVKDPMSDYGLSNSSKTDSIVSLTDSTNQSASDVNLRKSYGTMRYSGSSYEHNNIMYPPDCHTNNYWQDHSLPYFMYPSVSSSSELLPNSECVANLVKQSCESYSSTQSTSSSEIVDMDTKEIKTVETHINMNTMVDTKPVVKVESLASNYKGFSNLKEPAPVDDTKSVLDAASTQDTKSASGINMSGIEKDLPKLKSDDGIPYEWAIELMKQYEPGLISNSPKMEIFFCIVNESIVLGDRVLLFSQSLLTLNLIESFLQANCMPCCDVRWVRNVSYFRLDGSTSSQEREKLVNEFNSNQNVKLFLISTRAGSLGINLVGANRVIVFDASWNPCHDTQAVYRIYRYGQDKPCFVYRIVMDKCLEKKIYDRQIKKQGTSDRVVDECNPDAHLSMKDVTNLCHDYDDDEKNNSDEVTLSQPLDSYTDTIMQKIIEHHKTTLSKEPFQHESLLVDRKEKKLSQAEKRQAHRGYEMEKKACVKQTLPYSANKLQYRIVHKDGTVVTRPVASIRPMQNTTRAQNVSKAGSIRSTRWIPAEVWQRQGMTAQEMTLPLDVVIPTNSSDKANIILKAGQRVMVLKSAKGIYMQLDSGKIIAIRTSSKATEAKKEEKGEVIDITSDGDNVSDSYCGAASKPVKFSDSSRVSKLSNSTMDHSKSTTNDSPVKNNSGTDLNLKEHTNLKKGHSQFNATQVKQDTKFSPIKVSSTNPKKHTNNPSLHAQTMHKEKYETDFTKCALHSTANNGCATHISQTNKTAEQHKNQMLMKERVESVKKASFSESSQNCNMIKNNQFNSQGAKTTPKEQVSVNIAMASIELTPVLQAKEVSQPNNLLNLPSQNIPAGASHPTSSSSYFGVTSSELSKYGPSSIQRDEPSTDISNDDSKSNNGNKLQKGIPPNPVEYTPQQHNHPNCENTAQLPHYSTFQHQPPLHQQQPKYSAYMPPHYSMPHMALNDPSVLPPHSRDHQPSTNPQPNLPTNSYFSNRELHNFPQYYDNMFDGNNLPTACDYASSFADYPAYGSYGHPHYHPHYHANTYGGVPPPPIVANPYNINWSPLVAATPIGEPCNNMYSSTYTQNGAQTNQWQHKL